MFTFLKEKKFFYGWVIVVIGAFGVFFSGPGQTYSVSIFSQAYMDVYGWSRSLVSSYYSLATLFAGLLLPMIGRLIDKKGQRKMMTIIASVLGLVCLWMSFVQFPWMLFIGFMALRLFGQGSMSLLPATLIPQWFMKNRGKALSLMAIGGVLGSAVMPPLNYAMIDQFGIAFAWRFWMILLIGFMAPITWIFVRDKPENIGEIPDGILQPSKNIKKIKRKKIEIVDHPWTLKEASATRAFWMFIFCMIIPSMVNTGITFHMVSIILEKGHDGVYAAFLLSIVALVQFPTTFVAGFVVDHVAVHLVKAINYLLLGIAILLLMYSKSPQALVIYAVVHGIFVGFDGVSTGVLWPNYFGRTHLGSIRGVTMTAMVIVSALGPLPFGIYYDLFSSYKGILTIMIIFPVLGSIAAFISPPPKPKWPNIIDGALKESLND